MRRFKFRPYKVKISGWQYNGIPLDSDGLHPAILCATEKDADLLLELLENKVQEWRGKVKPEREGVEMVVGHLREEWTRMMGFDDEIAEGGCAPSWMRDAVDYLEKKFLQSDEIEMVDAGVIYQVLDGDRAADENGFPRLVGKGWTNSIFHSLDEARIYLARWLNVPEENTKDVEPDSPFDYSGHGDIVEIKSLPVKGPKEANAQDDNL